MNDLEEVKGEIILSSFLEGTFLYANIEDWISIYDYILKKRKEIAESESMDDIDGIKNG